MTTGRINQVTVVWPRLRHGGLSSRTARLPVERRREPTFFKQFVTEPSPSLQILQMRHIGTAAAGRFWHAQRRCRELSTSREAVDGHGKNNKRNVHCTWNGATSLIRTPPQTPPLHPEKKRRNQSKAVQRQTLRAKSETGGKGDKRGAKAQNRREETGHDTRQTQTANTRHIRCKSLAPPRQKTSQNNVCAETRRLDAPTPRYSITRIA